MPGLRVFRREGERHSYEDGRPFTPWAVQTEGAGSLLGQINLRYKISKKYKPKGIGSSHLLGLDFGRGKFVEVVEDSSDSDGN
jgi:hypothetical protein